ncbi:MAG: bifunctional nuclease family protein [Actinomycetota bacterium]
MIPMALMGVRVEMPNNQPIVLLREEGGARYLPIFIGVPEATAIGYALQGVDPPRPMTHDLFATVMAQSGVRLEQVEITELHDGTYFAELALTHGDETLRVSARPSDAIALAVRMGHEVPILAADEVLDEAGVVYETDEAVAEESLGAPDIEEFREFLDQVSPEDFAD